MSEDHAAEARRAEKGGDLLRAVGHWQAFLRGHPGDPEARVELGRLLLEAGETTTARTVLLALDHPQMGPVALQANRLLARLDEREGLLASAGYRWERLQADDIDDPEALRHQRLLRRTHEPAVGTTPPSWLTSTLLTPEGVDLQRYRLVRELGRGGNGVVYLADDLRLGRQVALKILHAGPNTARRREAETRFFREQKALARLRHPGLVAVYALDPVTRSLALEPMLGGSLRASLREQSGAPVSARAARAGTLLETLAPALAFVHARGLLHGDIKPGNILLREDGSPALADFGGSTIADERGRDRDPDPAANAGAVAAEPPVGTPLYFAPELFNGAPPSPATDVFALGAVGWEALTGAPWRSHLDLMAGRYGVRPSAPPEVVAYGAEVRAAATLLALLDALTSPSPATRLEALAALVAPSEAESDTPLR